MSFQKRRRRTNLQILKDAIIHNEIGKGLETVHIDQETHTATTNPKPREVNVEPSVKELKEKQKKIPYINTRLLLTKR